MYSFYFLVINALRMSSKCFVYKWWVGDKPTFCKIVLKIKKKISEINYVGFMLNYLPISVSVNSVDI